ncbi:hypothetical protein P4V52_21535 [Brevibacillus formosus]|nr:hypothetical protein [Brevibacillus formosus]MED1959295.1 hypothetical protein [Brevibacillus formosus]
MAATDKKPVHFNLEDPIEKAMFEYSKTINFSGWVKEQMRPVLDSIT